MMKFLKRIFLFSFLLLIVILISYGFYWPGQDFPYPYQFGNRAFEGVTEAEEAKILFMGDIQASFLKPYQQTIEENLDRDLKDPKIYNWGKDGEGLHVSLKKLRSLTEMPEVIIYHGGSQEWNEARFKDRFHLKVFSFNLKTYLNPWISSISISFPQIGKFFFIPYKRLDLSQERAFNFPKNDIISQEIIEHTFKIFEQELDRFSQSILQNGKKLILTTVPINYRIPPGKTCSNADHEDLLTTIDYLERAINQKKIKESQSLLRKTLPSAVGHAKLLYLAGRMEEAGGNFDIAYQYFLQARALDCKPPGPHPVFNAIIRKYAKQNGIPLVDFEQLLKDQFGRNITHFDDRKTQTIFTERFIENLVKEVRFVLNL